MSWQCNLGKSQKKPLSLAYRKKQEEAENRIKPKEQESKIQGIKKNPHRTLGKPRASLF